MIDDNTRIYLFLSMICMYVMQCLLAARDGFDAESSSETLKQLYRLGESLEEGAISNATLVRKYG